MSAWEQLVPMLLGMGVLTTADGNALARYCHMLAQWVELQADIEENGFVDYSEQGEKPRAVVKIADSLASQLLKIEQHFGLTPSARSRIQIEKPKPKTGLENFRIA